MEFSFPVLPGADAASTQLPQRSAERPAEPSTSGRTEAPERPAQGLRPPLTAHSTSKSAAEQTSQPLALEAAIVPPDFKRQKIPLEKGYSQMDWMRVNRLGKDLTGKPLNGQENGRRRREAVTMAEVREHNTMEDGWTVIKGVVYNVTPYLRFHPGGAKIMKLSLGRDSTELFDKYHRWVNIAALMEKSVVGALER